jgi:hypothetical protein
MTGRWEMEDVMAPYRKVHKNMQKKAKQSKTTSLFSKSSVSLSAMHSIF